MKKFTKISLIVVAVMLGLGALLGGISSLMGAGTRTVWQMAENGDLNYGKWHIGPEGIYYGLDDDEKVLFGPNGVYYDSYMVDDIEVGDIEVGDIDTGINDNKSGSVNNMEFTIPATEIKNLDLNIDAAEVYIEKSTDADSVRVELKRGKEKYFECYKDGDTLVVEYDTNNHYNTNNTPVITIALPDVMSLEEVEMKTGAANVTVEDVTLKCKELSIEVGAGNLVADRFDVEHRMDVSIGAGNFEIEDGSYGDIKIDCGIGNVDFGGQLKGDMTVHCGMGNVEMELAGEEADYNYSLSCGMGELNVNGVSYSNIAGSRNVTNDGAIGTISLDCGMGGIELRVK